MLPRLQAEERCQAINDMACASGNLLPEAAKRHQQALQRAANGGVRQRRAPASPAQLAASGVGLRIVSEPSDAPLSDPSGEGASDG